MASWHLSSILHDNLLPYSSRSHHFNIHLTHVSQVRRLVFQSTEKSETFLLIFKKHYVGVNHI